MKKNQKWMGRNKEALNRRNERTTYSLVENIIREALLSLLYEEDFKIYRSLI